MKLHFHKPWTSPLFPVSRRDFLVTAAILGCALALCFVLRIAGTIEGFASPVFVLAVLLISRLTTGYLYGLIAVVLGVVCVNFIFTFPYWAFNLSISGYPLTFFTLLMVSIISHDLRTPLTSIVGSTSAVLESPDLTQEEQRTLLENAREEAQWLIRVVENLLSITRIGEDDAKIRKESEAAEEVIGEAARKFRRRFPGVRISVSIPDELLMAPMDPILIEQVLSNLLENAVFHGGAEYVVLSLTERNGCACFSVADDGTGIPKKALSSLFDGKAPSHTAPDSDGKRNMGLGLSVCQAIVRAHGGSIQARNLERGAEFSFQIPLTMEAVL